MIIKVNKYNLFFSSITNSIIKKNNLEYCRFHNNNKFYYIELNNFIKIIEYSLFLNIIEISEKDLEQKIENLFELINLYYNNIYYYGIIINMIIHLYLKKKKKLLKNTINKCKNALKVLKNKNENYNILFFFINNFKLIIPYKKNKLFLKSKYTFNDFILDAN